MFPHFRTMPVAIHRNSKVDKKKLIIPLTILRCEDAEGRVFRSFYHVKRGPQWVQLYCPPLHSIYHEYEEGNKGRIPVCCACEIFYTPWSDSGQHWVDRDINVILVRTGQFFRLLSNVIQSYCRIRKSGSQSRPLGITIVNALNDTLYFWHNTHICWNFIWK